MKSGSDRNLRPDPAAGIPATPPAAVEQAVDGAAQVYERLAAEGREVRFASDAETRRIVVQIHDSSGNAIRRLKHAELFGMLNEGV